MDRNRVGLLAVASLLILSAGLRAQDAPVVRRGDVEVGAFVGASYGIDQARVMGGGNVAYSLTRYFMPYAEYSYFPGIGRSQSIPFGDSTVKVNYSVPLSDFHGGAHIRFPIADARVVPYLVLGAGGLHSYERTETVTLPAQGSLPSKTITVPVPARTDFAVNFGGGLRFYLNERFGVRVEAKAYKPTGTFSSVFGKAEGGFFFMLR